MNYDSPPLRMLAVRIAVLGLFLIILNACDAKFSSGKQERYLTSPVSRESLSDEVLAVGSLQAVDQVDIGAQVSGQLKKLAVRLGDSVHKNQLLAELDPVLPLNSLKAAQARSRRLEAEREAQVARVDLATFKWQSQSQMISEGATARQSFEEARVQLKIERANLASLDAQIQEAQIEVQTAEANLAFTRITAPMDGTVVSITTQQGQTVIAEQEAPVILKLANLSTMTIRAQVSEADIRRVQPGQAAYFTTLGDSDTRHPAILRNIEPAPQNFLASQSGSDSSRFASAVFYTALFDVENPDSILRIGETAQVHILLATSSNALTIPLAALNSREPNGVAKVRVLENHGAVTERGIHVGISNELNAEDIDGLNEGDEVILGELQQDADE